MNKTTRSFLLSVILVIIVSSAAACNSNSTTPGKTSTTITPAATGTTSGAYVDIRAYADPATETALQGFSEGNQAKYTQYGSPEFIGALTKADFDKAAAALKTQLGTYVSKEFVSTEQQDVYTVVHYKVKFTKTSVGVKIVFDKNHKIAGQWFE